LIIHGGQIFSLLASPQPQVGLIYLNVTYAGLYLASMVMLLSSPMIGALFSIVVAVINGARLASAALEPERPLGFIASHVGVASIALLLAAICIYYVVSRLRYRRG